jgi:hypothetical protein
LLIIKKYFIKKSIDNGNIKRDFYRFSGIFSWFFDNNGEKFGFLDEWNRLRVGKIDFA